MLLFALFPSSLFLWAFYSEGLFIALGAGAVWADKRDRRWLAAALMVPIGATRSVGILIPAVLILARIVRQRRIDRWAFIYGAAGSVGLLATLAMMKAQVGDPFAFVKVQKDWGRSLSMPWTTVMQGYQNLWPRRGTVMVPALVARNFDLWCVAIVLAALAYAAWSERDRFPMETWMLGVAMIVLPLCSSVLASFNRFVFADWVIYPVYASAIGRLPKYVAVGGDGLAGRRPDRHRLRHGRPVQRGPLRRLAAHQPTNVRAEIPGEDVENSRPAPSQGASGRQGRRHTRRTPWPSTCCSSTTAALRRPSTMSRWTSGGPTRSRPTWGS